MKLTNGKTVIDAHPSSVDNMIRKGWKPYVEETPKPKAKKKKPKVDPEVAEFDGEIIIVNEDK